MVLLTMTPSIVEAVNQLFGVGFDDIATSNDEPSLKDPSVGKPISHGQIVDIWKRLKDDSSNATGLEQLLRGATVYVPPPPPKPEPVRPLYLITIYIY